MSYTVKNMKEINYIGMSKEEMQKIWRLDDLYMQQECTFFDEEGDYFALYLDTDVYVDAGFDNDDRAYAVYMNNSGQLLCLLSDAGSCLNGFCDSEYGYKRNALYKQIAMLAGWPEHIAVKKPYTVTVKRVANIKVYAKDKDEAALIGDALVAGSTELACMTVNEAMCNGDDMDFLVDDFDAGCLYHETLSVEQCNELLAICEEN